jgi:hypothetical protein
MSRIQSKQSKVKNSIMISIVVWFVDEIDWRNVIESLWLLKISILFYGWVYCDDWI